MSAKQNPIAPKQRVADPTVVEATFVSALLTWYGQHRRPLPWRHRPTPYAVWVAEIMLQQTRMETAVPRWHAFLARFPDVHALAQASEYDVCEAWAGLGYYSRARNLHRAACAIVRDHGGQFPRTAAALRALPGIGPYTAGAIASIAFGEATPLVDGNVVRVLARVFAIGVPFAKRADVATFWRQAQRLVEQPAARANPGEFNQALMEFGSLQCVPRAPLCLLCPARALCGASTTGRVHALPVPVKKAKPVAMEVAFALRCTARGVVLVRRPLSGLWAGQWEPPSAVGPRAKAALEARGYRLGRTLAHVTHVLSHRLVTARVYLCTAARTPRAPAGEHRVVAAAPLSWPLSRLAHKAVAAAIEALPRSAASTKAVRSDAKRTATGRPLIARVGSPAQARRA